MTPSGGSGGKSMGNGYKKFDSDLAFAIRKAP